MSKARAVRVQAKQRQSFGGVGNAQELEASANKPLKVAPPRTVVTGTPNMLQELLGVLKIEEAFQHHQSLPNGLYLKPDHALLEDKFLRMEHEDLGFDESEAAKDLLWTPGPRDRPALPFPFTAAELAAFMEFGAGDHLASRWPAEAVEAKLAKDGSRATDAFRLLAAAHELSAEAKTRFPFPKPSRSLVARLRRQGQKAPSKVFCWDVVNQRAEWLLRVSATDVISDGRGAASSLPTLDYTLLANPTELVRAFGKFTGMTVEWFQSESLRDCAALKAARRQVGRGGAGIKAQPPLFCPFAVLNWLLDRKRRKGRPLNRDTGWRMLETNFPGVYQLNAGLDPREQ